MKSLTCSQGMTALPRTMIRGARPAVGLLFLLLLLLCSWSSVVSSFSISQRSTSHHSRSFFRHGMSSSSDDSTASAATNANDADSNMIYYQRVFYRFTPGSDVAMPNAIVVEERCRFCKDNERPDYILPFGPRTIILRDGQVEDGEIGDDFYSMPYYKTGTSSTFQIDGQSEKQVAKAGHNGAGTDIDLQAAIACAMYLASDSVDSMLSTSHARILHVACQSGLASLLGCIGAGYMEKKGHNDNDEKAQAVDVADDILTISNKKDTLFPSGLDLLMLTDVNESVMATSTLPTLKASGISSNKVAMDVLDWRVRSIQPRGASMGMGIQSQSQQRERRMTDEYHTVVGCDVSFSYPETKELARTVTNRLLPTAPFFCYAPTSSSSSSSSNTLPALPRFVYVCPDGRDDLPYLRRILEKGYRMSTSTHYLKLEKLTFQLQKLKAGEPESALDDLELELQDFKEVRYESLVAQHHPDYAGDGSGEFFFPIETGEYEATGGSTFLEKEAGSSPW